MEKRRFWNSGDHLSKDSSTGNCAHVFSPPFPRREADSAELCPGSREGCAGLPVLPGHLPHGGCLWGRSAKPLISSWLSPLPRGLELMPCAVFEQVLRPRALP